jgi:hypothetical protein
MATEEKEKTTLSDDAKEEIELTKGISLAPTSPDDIFAYAEDGAKFLIRFEKIYDKPKLQTFDEFDMSAKRNFKMMCGLIKETYDTIFLKDQNVDPDLSISLLHILNVQSKIMHATEPISASDFVSMIDTIMNAGDKALIKKISDFVDNGYALSLDEDTEKMREKKKAVNAQLIISDDYAKTMIKIAYLDRIVIPLMSQYFIYNKASFPTKNATVVNEDQAQDTEPVDVEDDTEIDEAEARRRVSLQKHTESATEDEDQGDDMVFEDVNQTIFNHLFEAFAKENTEFIKNKLWKMVWARVVRTAFSNKGFWTVANTMGISKESVTLEIYQKLLTNSVPKIILSKDLNVVNYFSAIINNQIKFLFSNKFKVHYQSINPNTSAGTMFESNDDNMTEFEKMEIKMGRKNEGNLVIQGVIADDVIKNIDTYMDVSVSKEEIASVMKYIHLNQIQERVVSMLTFKYFESTDAIKRLNAYDYAKLLLCCEKYLVKNKFVLLPKLLLSTCVKQRDRTTITGVKIKTKIEDSQRYKDLLNTKYKDFKSEIEKPIQSMISTIYNSSFIDDAGNDIFETSTKIGNVGEEIVDLCYLI